MQGQFREELREKFFSLTNDASIHCDADFSPTSTDKIVRQLVKTLSAGRPFTPLHVGLKSQESHPIQLADIICGAAKTLIRDGRLSEVGLNQIPFDNKLKGKETKAYYWTE